MNELFDSATMGEAQGPFPRGNALCVAEGICAKIDPHCDLVSIAGSIRRNRPTVNDIDLVILNPKVEIHRALVHANVLILSHGPKYWRCRYNGYPLDLYFANDETFWTLLLIRTGSKEHNIMLCQRAQSRGMVLKADGRGLFRLAVADCGGDDSQLEKVGDINSEADIFRMLDLPYKAPAERECP